MQEANKKLFTEVKKGSRAENWRLQAGVLSKIEKELEATSGKLQEIHKSVSKRITGVKERVSHLEKPVNTKVDNLENS